MNQWIMGRRSKKVYQLGGQVTVRVKNADVQRRQIDLELMDALPFNRAVKRLNPKKKKEKKEVKRKKRRR
jgi:ribonuclease R